MKFGCIPGAPFSLLFLNKYNDTSGLDHLSGPLSQILRESVRSRLSSGSKRASIERGSGRATTKTKPASQSGGLGMLSYFFVKMFGTSA